MRKKLSLIMLAFLLYGCGQKEDNSGMDNTIPSISCDSVSSISDDTAIESEVMDSAYLSNENIVLNEWDIEQDSYIYKFITNQYSIEFDSEAYEEKLKKQLPAECAFIYDSDLYVEGTLNDMMNQYGEYLNYQMEVYAEINYAINSQGEKWILVYLSNNDMLPFYMQINLVETDDGLEVVYMRDYNPYIRFSVYNDGFLYTKDELAGNTDLYFTCVDRAGDFILVSHAYYESNNIDAGSFEDECRHYVEQQGLEYDEIMANEIGGLDYEKEVTFYKMIYRKHSLSSGPSIHKDK